MSRTRLNPCLGNWAKMFHLMGHEFCCNNMDSHYGLTHEFILLLFVAMNINFDTALSCETAVTLKGFIIICLYERK